MLDFKEEISKYKPLRTVDDLHSPAKDELKDIMDMLTLISGQAKKEVRRTTRLDER